MPMSLTQALLGKIAEECAEVAQRALKAQQFGLDERQTSEHATNAARVWEEWLDLYAVMMLMFPRRPYNLTADDERHLTEKITRMRTWLEYAVTQGQVHPWDATQDAIALPADWRVPR